MADRLRHGAATLRRVEPPTDLWDRIAEGPSHAPLPPRPRARVAAAVAGLAIFGLVAGLLWVTLSPLDRSVRALAGPEVVPVPARGEVSPVFLPDGRPVFVVHHLDGTLSVVDAFSSHRA